MRLSYYEKKNILTRVMKVISTNKGSVGTDNHEPPVRSSSVTDKGVARTTNHMAQSNLYKVSHTTNKAGGMRKAYHCSNATPNATSGRVIPMSQ